MSHELVHLSADHAAQPYPPLGPHPRVLMVRPGFPSSYWGMAAVFDLIPEQSNFPPLGLMTVAALCPSGWDIRLIDCAVDELRDADLLWADLVMVSAIYGHQPETREVLARARSLGRRTFIGGPWATCEPELALAVADQIFTGEAEEYFPEVARLLEQGTSQRVFAAPGRPDMTASPIPRYDLVHIDAYTRMSLQTTRGCPYECEFCDAIILFGRRPRMKTPEQVLREFDAIYALGWRKEIDLVDDNFIGHSAKALELSKAIAAWQRRHGYPFMLTTQATVDLADRPDLLKAMTEANVTYVFFGIETPSAEALRETRKFQNLRKDNAGQIRRVMEAGIWISAGFIIGFDADREDIFERQREFIDRTSIPWAMTGLLQAAPHTPLRARLEREGRMLPPFESANFSPPNFETRLPMPILLRGAADLIRSVYDPANYFRRGLRSLERWRTQPWQRAPHVGVLYALRTSLRSFWKQGVRSDYRAWYWRFFATALLKWSFDRTKLWRAMSILLTAHHFVPYGRQVAGELDRQALAAEQRPRAQAAAAAGPAGNTAIPGSLEPHPIPHRGGLGGGLAATPN